MGYICAVKNCGHNTARDKGKYRFFRFPAIIVNQGEEIRELSKLRRRQWFANIYRKELDDKKAENSRVCSSHFISGERAELLETTNPDWAPTVNLGHDKIKQNVSQLAVSRNARAQKRNEKKRKYDEMASSSTSRKSGEVEVVQEKEYVEPETSKEYCQTDLDMAQLDRQQIYMQDITDELSSTKGQLLSAQLTEDSFRDNDDKTKFYTGIPKFSLLMHVLNLIAPHIKRNTQNALSQFQEFLLVLIRLKLNSPLQDLAYRFNISVPTAHRIFDRWIHVMSVRLKFLIQWPEHEELQATMPVVFQRNFGKKVAVIIDCFEIFTERPSSPIARAMTWSNYKHHNTVKFLIGVTPQVVISFISKAWGGRVSDKYLTENSGLLRKLLPGDIVLADKGFDIADSVGFYQARLHIPAFTRGKKQLSAEEAEETRKIANVRIHVERVIGLVRRKYTILQGILPIQLVTARQGDDLAPIDKIAIVCCALTNLSESIVPFD
ncbi:unnamed protein product [Porites evermanni]|uniref:THAP-type domain-containing protein n=1 Tax=Porites evermanni TaxID=104178 RepID=A0ABN8R3T8_9CNID|nr:unnamed protein product [Porites evermanni]